MLAYWSMQEVAHCATASTEAWQGEPLHAGKAVIGPVDVGASDWATAERRSCRDGQSAVLGELHFLDNESDRFLNDRI